MLHWTRTILKGGPRLVWAYFAWMRRYGGKHKEKYPLDKRYGKVRKIATKTCKALNSKFYVEGLEGVPDGAVAFFPNHVSVFDPAILISIIERNTAFVSKIELQNVIAVKQCISAIEGEYLDRKDIKQSLKVMMKVEKSLKENNKSWLIFPEGTRRKDEMTNCLPFHHGTFRPAVKAGVPIIPVAIFGSNRALNIKPQYHSYPTFVKFLKPIMPEEYKNMSTEEIAKYVQDEIDRCISFELRKKDHALMLKEKNYRFNYIYK